MGLDTSDIQLAESAFGFFQGAFGAPSDSVSVVDPDPQPQLEAVMPDYGEPLYDPGRPYLPAKDPSSVDMIQMPWFESPEEMYVRTEASYIAAADPEPSWLDRGWDIISSPEIKPLRDSLINEYLLKPETETVNTAGRTETHVNPQATPPRGSTPIGSIPQQTVFFPWQQPGDIGDAPQAGPGLGISPGVLLIGGLALFLLTR